MRALLPAGDDAVAAGRKVLSRLDLVRISTGVLDDAGVLLPADLRSLDAVVTRAAVHITRSSDVFAAGRRHNCPHAVSCFAGPLLPGQAEATRAALATCWAGVPKIS